LDEWLQASDEQYPYEQDARYEELLQTLNDEVEALRWYDREVLKLSLEHSVSSLARGTNISRDSLRNTLKIAKDELRERTEDTYQAWKEAEGLG
jgi:exonuclease VII small subunit